MSAITIISQAFGEDANLYTTVLSLSTTNPTQSQLRKAYYQQALKYHPDKQQHKSNIEQEDAKCKFQAISLAYSILSNDEKRKEYDETGEIDDNDDDDDDDGFGSKKSGSDMWKEFFTSTFGKVTTQDIDTFAQKYKCSDEEEQDVLKYYTMFKGNLDKMLECVMCSDEIDKKRWVEDYIKPAIEHQSVEDYSDVIDKTLKSSSSSKKKNSKNKNKKKKNTKANVKMNIDEVDIDDDDNDDEDIVVDIIMNDDDDEYDDKTETEDSSSSDNEGTTSKPKKKTQSTKSTNTTKNKNKKKSKGSDDDDLIAAIRGNALARRQGEQAFGSFMDSLEERYAPSKKRKKSNKKKAEPDISDDEFAKIQARLLKQKK